MQSKLDHLPMRALWPWLLVIQWVAAPAPAAAQDESATDAVAEAPPADPPVTELFDARADLQEFLVSTELPDTDTFYADRKVRLQELRSKLDEIDAVSTSATITSMALDDLVDLQTVVRGDLRSLGLLSDQLSTRAARRDAQLDELATRTAEWQRLTGVARSRNAPPSVLEMAGRMAEQLERARERLTADRNRALEDLSVIAGLQAGVTAFDTEVQRRLTELETVSQTVAVAPLWKGDVWTAPLRIDEAKRALSRQVTAISRPLSANAIWIAALFVFAWAGAQWLLSATGERVREAMQRDAMSVRAAAAFEHRNATAFLSGLLVVYWFGPPAPQAFQSLLLAVLPFPAAALAVTVFARPLRLTVYTLAAVLAVMSLRPFFEPMPLVGRLILLLQSLLTVAAVVIDFRRGRFRDAFPSVREKFVRWGVRTVCGALLLVMALEIVGQIGVANTARALVLGGLGLGMIFTSINYVLTGITLALLHLRPIAFVPVVRNQRWTIVRTVRKAVRWIMVILWALATLRFAGLLMTVSTRASEMLSSQVSIGELAIDVSSIAAGVAILLGTWLLNRLIRFILAGKSMTGVQVATGLTFAVSKLLRYAIAVAGFIFALAAMGFDLTKVTVLAGALGLGIGFGLQNIVQNFISGLILLFERPININDIAKVDDLMGTVRELNIRSTVIETFDGAEVIVPNADLVSKTVTNWTKSNRRRRAEIDVGVAYGSDSQQILDLLERIAKSHEQVMADPEPFAVFLGFGDSSLNFRLYIWLNDLSEVLKTPSRIRQDVLRELQEAGVEIPFPQRDVRVTMLPGADPATAERRGGTTTPDPAAPA